MVTGIGSGSDLAAILQYAQAKQIDLAKKLTTQSAEEKVRLGQMAAAQAAAGADGSLDVKV